MKVLLKKDVDTLGYAGEVFTVADGYGRNYLLPQGLAVKATPNEMKKAEAWRKQADTRREELRAEHEKLAERIVEVTLTFEARAGDSGKLYGSITTSQIADDLNELLGTEIDRRKVGNEPLRQLGAHKVVVRLSGEHQPEMTVVVNPEGGTYQEFEEEQAAMVIAAEALEEGDLGAALAADEGDFTYADASLEADEAEEDADMDAEGEDADEDFDEYDEYEDETVA